MEKTNLGLLEADFDRVVAGLAELPGGDINQGHLEK
jgi:hypothetical protein